MVITIYKTFVALLITHHLKKGKKHLYVLYKIKHITFNQDSNILQWDYTLTTITLFRNHI